MGGTDAWASSTRNTTPENSVISLAWTLDGYAISASFQNGGLAVWSVYGNLLCSTNEMEDIFGGQRDAGKENLKRLDNLQDTYIKNVHSMFWGLGNHQLFVLSNVGRTAKKESLPTDISLLVLPFVKSATTSYHTSDNARRGLLQMDDRLLLYNSGGDFQDNNTTTIDPDTVAWTHIMYPTMYITEHWPIQFASSSGDGKFIAIAGKRGLAHYNTISGRWKLFGNQQQEQHFLVRGGLAWYKHILVAACQIVHPARENAYEIHLYARDTNLDNTQILHTEVLQHAPVYINICGSYLLVYTTENTLTIYSIYDNTENGSAANVNGVEYAAQLEMVRQVSLIGIVARVARVRSISLFNGYVGDQLTTIDDIVSANIILLVDGKLLMLIPRAPDDDDDSDLMGSVPPQIRYELHVLADKIEYYWVGRRSVANMSTSLWAVTGCGIKIFANLLRGDDYSFRSFANDTIDSEPSTPTTPGFLTSRISIGRPYSLGYHIGPEPTSPSASIIGMDGYSHWQTDNPKQLAEDAIYIPLDFYPHSVLLEKGIIAGIEQSMVFKDSLGFSIFKMSTKTLLFLHHILRHLLKRGLEEDAVVFARAYEKLVYFGHALEILLHTILEEETDKRLGEDAILPLVIKFLDHFPHALDVIVSCARKTEVALWDHLFSAVGKPKDLFELCLADGRLRTATSYLIILQTMQPLAVGGKDTIRLLQKAMDENDYDLCKELVRFLSSIDSTGKTLQQALQVIKLRMDNGDPSSPHSDDAQVEKVVQSMENLNNL
ncbi:hypothetical protein DFQ28_002894 [Apophysomyces sp. BC1034]|nr:hypothetical protein DFQ30_005662 [Apophysomyces sp. BC1015]KAG0179094.1 hypothetical protein DFQ29_002536 [Apophysomyces sp. BC1021]KAG0189794.1 hypothetical protein DFQ28_002894 [Apophysomyces sp. BC1034]